MTTPAPAERTGNGIDNPYGDLVRARKEIIEDGSMLDEYEGRDLEALVEVTHGSQWTVTGRSMGELVREAQDIIGRDLKGEDYYVREVSVDGQFDPRALNEFMAALRR